MPEVVIQIILIVEELITALFVLDLLVGFRRGYICDKTGDHITSSGKIAIRYLKFFFWIDLLASIPFEHITANSLLCIIRMIKVPRLLRFNEIIHFFGFTDEMKANIRIAQLIVALVILIHWTACLFYVVAIDNWEDIKS